jgi:hypothetical protein
LRKTQSLLCNEGNKYYISDNRRAELSTGKSIDYFWKQQDDIPSDMITTKKDGCRTITWKDAITIHADGK